MASGRPTWDPVAQVVHVNGQTLGPFTSNTGLPDYFNNSYAGNAQSIAFIDQGTVAYWGLPNTSVSSVPLLAASGGYSKSGTARFMSPSSAAGTSGAGTIAAQPLFSTTPSVNDKALYDWSSINLASINSFLDQTETSSFQVDQVLLNSSRQSLAVQGVWVRENAQRFRRNLVGQADLGQNGQLLVDVNERLLDGSANPFFLRPYIGLDKPLTYLQPARWDTYRGQIAYKLDLTKEPNFLRWLGKHQLTGYYEYKYRINRQYAFRDVMADTHAWLPASTPRANNDIAPNLTMLYSRYYVGDKQGTNVDYAPTSFNYGAYPFVWGGQNGVFNREPVRIDRVPTNGNSTGGPNNSLTILKSVGAVMQSHFLDDRIITTVGLREDRQYVKNGKTPIQLNPADGTALDYESVDHWTTNYKFNSGKTKTTGAVVRPFRDLGFITREAAGGNAFGRFVANAFHGLSLTYNKSDSFRPVDPALDIFLRPVQPPTGKGTDYGFWLNMFDGKLIVRLNRYETRSENNSAGDAGTIVKRAARIDATQNAPFQLNTQATAWVTALNPTWSVQQVQAEVAKQIGLSTEVQNAIDANFDRLTATQDLTAKGTELEVNINPSRYWTASASATDTRSITNNVSTTLEEWIAARMPIWTTIVDQRTGKLWWTTNYGGSQTAAQNYAARVQAPFSVLRQQEGKSNPQIRRYAYKLMTNLQLAAVSDNATLKHFSVGGALRWEDKGAIGYYGKQSLPAVITELDPDRPIYDKAHAYIDAFVSYRTKMFSERVMATFRFNVRNVQEGGRLQPIGAYPDGTPNAYRIVDPRQFILQCTLDL